MKLKKYIVGVRARFRARELLFVLGSLNSYILVMKIKNIFENINAFMALIVASSPPNNLENAYCT